VESGEWREESGKRKVESGKWKVEKGDHLKHFQRPIACVIWARQCEWAPNASVQQAGGRGAAAELRSDVGDWAELEQLEAEGQPFRRLVRSSVGQRQSAETGRPVCGPKLRAPREQEADFSAWLLRGLACSRSRLLASGSALGSAGRWWRTSGLHLI